MFKVTIRELLLLTLVVALAVGWLVERSRFVERNEMLAAKNEELVAKLEQATHEAAQLRIVAFRARELYEGLGTFIQRQSANQQPGSPPVQLSPQYFPNP